MKPTCTSVHGKEKADRPLHPGNRKRSICQDRGRIATNTVYWLVQQSVGTDTTCLSRGNNGENNENYGRRSNRARLVGGMCGRVVRHGRGR